MRILICHNEYASRSGEEVACEKIIRLLQKHGHEVFLFKRSSSEIKSFFHGKIQAFFSGFHNPRMYKKMNDLLDSLKPDVVQIQNLYPFLSPSILSSCIEHNIPVVMRCPNYRLFCPTGLCFSNNAVCEKCTGLGREMNCIFRNCTGDMTKSFSYALRNGYARIFRRIVPQVNMFIVQSNFQKNKFIENGIDPTKIQIVPGFVPPTEKETTLSLGESVSFVGRVSPEKGIYDFLQAAKILKEISFGIAGNTNSMLGIENHSTTNVTWHGFLETEALHSFFMNSRILVFPSQWYEGFPNVLIHAMNLGKSVIGTRIGAMAEIIEDGVTGLLYEPGDVEDLAHKINKLFNSPESCYRYGYAGKKKTLTHYSEDITYNAIMQAYVRAIQNRG